MSDKRRSIQKPQATPRGSFAQPSLAPHYANAGQGSGSTGRKSLAPSADPDKVSFRSAYLKDAMAKTRGSAGSSEIKQMSEMMKEEGSTEIDVNEMIFNYHVQKIQAGVYGEFTRVLYDLVESIGFKAFIMIVVVVQALFLCLESFDPIKYRVSWYFDIMDAIFTGFYTVEMILKLIVWHKLYFKEGWNWLDFVVVMGAYITLVIEATIGNQGAGNISSLRVLRILRVFRAMKAIRILKALRFFRKLQVILKTIILSIKSLVAIVVIISVIVYIFGVIGRGLYGHIWQFSSLPRGLFFLFGILTMDDWYSTMAGFVITSKLYGSVVIFLIVYFMINWLIMINLFIAVLVDNFTIAMEKEEKDIGPIEEEEEEEGDLAGQDADDDIDEIGYSDPSAQFDLYYPMKEYTPGMRLILKAYFKTLITMSNCLYILKSKTRILDTIIEYTGLET